MDVHTELGLKVGSRLREYRILIPLRFSKVFKAISEADMIFSKSYKEILFGTKKLSLYPDCHSDRRHSNR